MTQDDDHSWLKEGDKLSSADVRRQYDDWARSYDETLASWDYRAPWEAARMLQPLLAADAAILDAGCGTGLSGQALRDAGWTGRIDGWDISPDSIEQARQRGIYDEVAVVDFNTPPLPGAANVYDAVICIGVLTYMQDRDRLFREFCRVTRPGGYVLFTHRDDLAGKPEFHQLIDGLAAEGVWDKLELTEPRPYLPGNPDFGDRIGAVYGLFRVR